MIDLLIIADDFTGALDTAVQFSKSSIETAVFLYKDLYLTCMDEKLQVVVVDTESRHVSGGEAARRVRETVQKAQKSGVRAFYKKTDSVLRGNIGSELAALMEAAGASELMFIPAYPDAGRTTLKGCQYMNGVPINETTFASDPVNPVIDCRIPEIIGKQANIPVVVVGREGLTSAVKADIDGQTIYVFDAENNNDLSKIANLLQESGKTALTAGCAGFAGMLPEMLGLKERHITKSSPKGKMLTVCGSISEISLRQVRYAKNHGYFCYVLNSHQKLTQDYHITEDGKKFIDEVADKIEAGRDVIITVAESFEDRIEYINPSDGVGCSGDIKQQKNVSLLIAPNIAGIVKGIADKTNLDTLTIIGGDTAVEIAESMALSSITPRCEIYTGVVLSDAVRQGKRISLITKSGGFGAEDILVKIKNRIML